MFVAKPWIRCFIMDESIKHTGYVSEVDGNKVTIQLSSSDSSDCSGCAIKFACSSAKGRAVTVRVEDSSNETLQVGSKVRITASVRVRVVAMVLLLVIPTLLMILTGFVCSLVSESESVMAICCLLLCACYFVLLWLQAKKLERLIKWKIDSIEL